MEIILIVFAFPWIFLGYMFWRNGAVHRLRVKIIDEVYHEGLRSRSYNWARYEALPSYETMLLKFWIPLSQFEKESHEDQTAA